MLAGQPLELRRIPFSDVPKLKGLEFDPRVQFEPELANFAIDALKPHIAGPAFGCIENGRVSKANHFHVFIVPGACELDASNGVTPDDQLPQRAAYLGKNPPLNFENALAYLNVKRSRAGGRVADRYFGFNLGNARTRLVTLAMIEAALGYSLAKPQTAQPSEVKAVDEELSPDEFYQLLKSMPMLRDVTLEAFKQVANLYCGWTEGHYDGVPLRLQGKNYPDLGRCLGTYFEPRTWLSPGEVADLVDIAVAFGLDSNTSKAVKGRRRQTGHVGRIASPPARHLCKLGT